MALTEAILAALAEDEASGYDLAKRFDVNVANFWTATPQQLYRELERMEAAGLVEARVVTQERRPNKRLFSLTKEGRAALSAFVARSPRPTAIRDELLVQVEAMAFGEPADLRSSIEEHRLAATAKLDRYRRSRDFLLGGRTEARFLAEDERVGRYLTLSRGISFEEENIHWCDFVLGVLDERELRSRRAAR